MTNTFDTAELKRLLAEGTPGPIRLMDGDPLSVDFHAAVYAPKMTGATPVTQLAANAALIVAAVNTLPELLARIETLEAAERDAKFFRSLCVKADLWPLTPSKPPPHKPVS